MKLLFVSKRHPQQRDLVERPYGRFFHLPRLMAARGHEVEVLLGSHRRLPSLDMQRDGVAWRSIDIRTLGPARFVEEARRIACASEADWIVGCSDAWFGWLAHRLARAAGTRLAIDAYDNYESYMPWNIPLRIAWRRAVAAADQVIAAGPQLATLLGAQRPGRNSAAIVPMAADPRFAPQDRGTARSQLALPSDRPLIGYTGGWARNRGTNMLLDAFRLLRARRPQAKLVVTGSPPSFVLREPGVHPLGYVDDDRLPTVLSAVDVAAVITTHSAFGRYSYPSKLCEAMACGVAVAATATEPVRWMLGDDERFLAPVGDAPALADRIASLLDRTPVDPYGTLTDWQSGAAALEAALMRPLGTNV